MQALARHAGAVALERIAHHEEASVTRWIGAATLALILMFAGFATGNAASATSLPSAAQAHPGSKAADVGARRRIHHHYRYRYAYRPYDPVYYDRPYYYAPAPFFPFLGLGYGPWW
jgi:hypothetical protein